MMELDIDTGKAVSPIRFLWEGTGNRSPEAPHIYHIGDWYYLTIAEGGTQFGHMETAARSRDIWGPYEAAPVNPILTNVHTKNPEVQCTGHSDLIQVKKGKLVGHPSGHPYSAEILKPSGKRDIFKPCVMD